jgi:hypothetical protein
MQYHLRQAMIFLNAFSFGTPEIFVAQAPTKFDEKTLELKDEDHQEACGPTARRLREVHRAREGLTARAIATPQASYDHIDFIGWCGLSSSAAIGIARSKAGWARFLTLIHSRQRPER